MCLYCTKLAVFTGTDSLREPTELEQAEFDTDPRIIKARMILTLAHEMMGKYD